VQTLDATDISGMVASSSPPVDGSTILASGGMISATGSTARLAISGGMLPSWGRSEVARVSYGVRKADLGTTADTTFTWLTASAILSTLA
jgi:hypothetical protein